MRWLVVILAVVALWMPALAQAEDDALDLTLSQNLERPVVAKRSKEYVRVHMDQLRRTLAKSGLEAKPMRYGEVLHITVPCSALFGIGSTELSKAGVDRLRGLGFVARDPKRYKIVVAVHTDDTGDEQYADSISAARANAIDDALWELAGERETNVIPYGIGKDEPLVPNNSRDNRARNRRVDIYIVPETII